MFFNSILQKLSPGIIFDFNWLQNQFIQHQEKTSSPRLLPSCSHLTASRAFQIALMCLLCPYDLRNARKRTYFDL
jgi:hypothetical protein